MEEVSIIGVDLAKNVFQLHGAAADGSVLFRKKLTRLQFERFMAAQPACTVAMEACAGAHHWARVLAGMGHAPLLIAPRYVKPFVKRHKNDSADAEAIVEAALRPTMRFVDPKTTDQQARAVLFRTRTQFIESRTVAVNALRAHLYEFGHTAPIGVHQIRRLAEVVEAKDSGLPEAVRLCCREILAQIAQVGERLAVLDREIARLSGEGETSRLLRTMPGVGPITALAVETFAPAMDSFRSGRDFAAWLGLVPMQKSTGGNRRERMAPISHLVIDECHRSAAQSYQSIIDEARALNPEIKLLGLSATPGRGDGRSLRRTFSNVGYHLKIGTLISRGLLVPPLVKRAIGAH